jgi:hypothetical protein
MGERRGAYTVLVVKTEGRPLRRSRRRWKDNIKTYLRDVKCEEFE